MNGDLTTVGFATHHLVDRQPVSPDSTLSADSSGNFGFAWSTDSQPAPNRVGRGDVMLVAVSYLAAERYPGRRRPSSCQSGTAQGALARDYTPSGSGLHSRGAQVASPSLGMLAPRSSQETTNLPYDSRPSECWFSIEGRSAHAVCVALSNPHGSVSLEEGEKTRREGRSPGVSGEVVSARRRESL